jgi:hypothetical protein
MQLGRRARARILAATTRRNQGVGATAARTRTPRANPATRAAPDRTAELCKPAITEVNSLSDYGVEAAAVLEQRRVVSVRLAWQMKSEAELKAAWPLDATGSRTSFEGPGHTRDTQSPRSRAA